MDDKDVFRTSEEFAKLPWRRGTPFDPFIASEKQGDKTAAAKLNYYRRRGLATKGLKRPGPDSNPNLLGRANKLFYASRPVEDPSWIWRFTNLNYCVSVINYWDGQTAKRVHRGEGWYLRMNSLWRTPWPFKPQNRLTK